MLDPSSELLYKDSLSKTINVKQHSYTILKVSVPHVVTSGEKIVELLNCLFVELFGKTVGANLCVCLDFDTDPGLNH